MGCPGAWRSGRLTLGRAGWALARGLPPALGQEAFNGHEGQRAREGLSQGGQSRSERPLPSSIISFPCASPCSVQVESAGAWKKLS